MPVLAVASNHHEIQNLITIEIGSSYGNGWAEETVIPSQTSTQLEVPITKAESYFYALTRCMTAGVWNHQIVETVSIDVGRQKLLRA